MITCPRCRLVSHNPKDSEEGYCGYCKDWTNEVRYLAIHPALWADLMAWLDARGLRVDRIPGDLETDDDPIYITSPIYLAAKDGHRE